MDLHPNATPASVLRSAGPYRLTSAGRQWAYVIAAWTCICLFNVEQSYVRQLVAGGQVKWMSLLVVYLPGMILWALCTPPVIALALRFPLDRTTWTRHLPLHVLAALLIAVVDAALYHVIDPWVNPNPPQTLLGGFLAYLRGNLVQYFVVVAIALLNRYAVLFRDRQTAAAELSAQLTTAHLRSLQAQLRPHFLFNTLNTIAELVHRDPDAADRMITRLGALLRRSFDTYGVQEVTLESELAFLRDYTDIVCARFQGRIRIAIDAEPDALAVRVPSLVLQPLVENAVRHGLEPRAAGGTVEIVARLGHGVLRLEVRDDGTGWLASSGEALRESREGVGLRNTRDRLRHLYGDAQSLVIRPREGGGTVVAMELPARRDPAAVTPVVRESSERLALPVSA